MIAPDARKAYGALVITGPEEVRELAAALAARFPVSGVVEEADSTLLCFDTRAEAEEAAAELETIEGLADARFSIDTIEEQNWNAEFEASLRPIAITETITVAQTWNRHEVPDDPDRMLVVIDPKMSFGTGDHETTRLVLRLIEGRELAGRSVLDAGTGTGLLAIVAARREASPIVAFDNNEWAELNARENCELNGVSEKVSLILGEMADVPDGTFDVILANMQLPIISELMPEFAGRLSGPDAILVTSGVLEVDRDDLIDVAGRNGLTEIETAVEGEWIGTVFSR